MLDIENDLSPLINIFEDCINTMHELLNVPFLTQL